MKKTIACVAALAVSLTAACSSSSSSTSSGGSGGSGSASSSKPFTLLAILPLSGPAASIGEAQLQGLKAGIAAVNKSGGINGRSISLSTKDDAADPTKAVSALQSALNSGTPDMVYPGVTSEEGLAVLPLLTQKKIFAMSGLVSEAVNNPSKYPYFFSNGQSLNPAADALAADLKQKGITKVAYLRPDSSNGQAALAAIKAAGKTAGISITDVTYNPTALDLTDVVRKATATSPGALVFDAYGASAGYILQARQKLQIKLPTYGDLAACLTNVATLVTPSALTGVQLSCPKLLEAQPAASQTPAFKTFLAAAKAGGSLKQMLIQYSGPYDTSRVLQAAAKQAGSTDAAKLKTAMESLPSSLDSQLVTYPTWRYTASDHEVQVPQSDYVLLPAGTVSNGQYTHTGT